MMTNATKTLSVMFAGAVLLLLLQLWLGGSSESEIFRGNLVESDLSRVNRITFNHPADTSFVELIKNNGAWQVHVNSETFKADSQKIKVALRELQNMEVEALVTRDPLKHTRYRVDSTGNTITFFENDQELDQVIASSSQTPGSSGDIYVRKPGNDRVFSVNGLRLSSIQSNFNYWRDLTVWNVPADSIREVRLTYPADSSFTVHKENDAWLAGADSLDEQKASTMVSMLANLEAAGYPPDDIDDSVSNPLYTVELLYNDGDSKTLNFYRFIDAEPAPFYLATASGYPYTFTLAKRPWDQAVLLSLEEYIEE